MLENKRTLIQKARWINNNYSENLRNKGQIKSRTYPDKHLQPIISLEPLGFNEKNELHERIEVFLQKK